MNMTGHQLSNEQWAATLRLFSEILDGRTPEEVIASEGDESIRGALSELWREHQEAERSGLLEEEITIVSQLACLDADVFHPAQIVDNRFAILRLLGRG